MGKSGPFRGELGEVTEGSIRTCAIVRWPAQVKPGTSSKAMFSIMDFLPTFARIVGGKMPVDRAIDGVDPQFRLRQTATMRSTRPGGVHRASRSVRTGVSYGAP